MEQQDKSFQRMDDLDYREPTKQGDDSSPIATPSVAHQCEVMLRVAAPSGKERTLDIATGSGEAATHFAPNVAELITIDRDPEAEQRLRAATGGAGNVYFEQAEASDLPFDDASFDLVLCHAPLHQFGDGLLDVLREARRVLKSPDGRLVAFDVLRAGGVDSSGLRGAEQLDQTGASAHASNEEPQGEVSYGGVIGGGESISGAAQVASVSSNPNIDASVESLVANYTAGELKTLLADAMFIAVSQEQLAREGHLEDSLPDVLAAVFVAKPQDLPYKQSSSNQ